ncbi:MAG: hypothetical protein AAFQ24_12315 [Pseudomonadota bacterium]
MADYVFLRSSPNWATFDLEDSREFMRRSSLPEDAIIKFAARWQKQFGQRYQSYREEMKSISLKSIADTNVQVIDGSEGIQFEDDDLIYFTDDDDWVAPKLFRRLRELPKSEDGYVWRSVYTGWLLVDTPHEPGGAPSLRLRPVNEKIYTNNYAVTGHAINRLGLERLFEHYHAKRVYDAKQWVPHRCDEFLSVANKHPCCTVLVVFNSRVDGYLENLRDPLREFIDDLKSQQIDPKAQWIEPYLQRFIEVNEALLN